MQKTGRARCRSDEHEPQLVHGLGRLARPSTHHRAEAQIDHSHLADAEDLGRGAELAPASPTRVQTRRRGALRECQPRQNSLHGHDPHGSGPASADAVQAARARGDWACRTAGRPQDRDRLADPFDLLPPLLTIRPDLGALRPPRATLEPVVGRAPNEQRQDVDMIAVRAGLPLVWPAGHRIVPAGSDGTVGGVAAMTGSRP